MCINFRPFVYKVIELPYLVLSLTFFICPVWQFSKSYYDMSKKKKLVVRKWGQFKKVTKKRGKMKERERGGKVTDCPVAVYRSIGALSFFTIPHSTNPSLSKTPSSRVTSPEEGALLLRLNPTSPPPPCVRRGTFNCS